MKKTGKIIAAGLVAAMLANPLVKAVPVNVITEDTYYSEDYFWGINGYGSVEIFGFEDKSTDSSHVVAEITEETAKGSIGVICKDVGSYKDNQIGAKVTVTDWKGTNGAVSFSSKGFGGFEIGGDLEEVTIKVEFFLATDKNQETIPMKGFMQLGANEASFVVENDFISALKFNYSEVESKDVEAGCEYYLGYYDSFEVLFDTGLSDNSMAITLKNNESKNAFLAMYGVYSITELGYKNIAYVNKKEVTQGSYLTYNYDLFGNEKFMLSSLAENSIPDDANAILIPIDKVLDIVNIKVMDRNHNNITSKVLIDKKDGYVKISTESYGKYIDDICFIEIQAKVKDNPEVNPEQIVDGKYMLYSSVIKGYARDYDKLPQGIEEEFNNYRNGVISNVVETELYYNSKITAPNCKFEGDGRYPAALDDDIAVTPDKGYYITKITVDGEELDISGLVPGEGYALSHELMNAHHEMVVEVAKLPATITVNCLVAGTNEELLKAVQDGFFMTDEYEVVAPEIDGYQLLKDPYPTNTKGIVDAENIEVTFYYEQIPETGDVNVLALGLTSLTSALGIAFSKKRFKK